VLNKLVITGGGNQSTVVNTPFAQPLQVTAQDQYGNVIPNLNLTFNAPVSGASATTSLSPITTDLNGSVSVPVTANSEVGSYIVSLVYDAVGADFTLTNNPAPVTVVPSELSFSPVLSFSDQLNIILNKPLVLPNFDVRMIPNVTLENLVIRSEIAQSLNAGNFLAILTLDALFTQQFAQFLDISPINDFNSIEAIAAMLSRLAQETGTRPAIIYVMVDEQQLTIVAITPGSRSGVASPGIWQLEPSLLASTEPLAYPVQSATQNQPLVRGIPEAKRSQLMPVVQRFLSLVKNERKGNAYLNDAQQLYRWLIAPMEQELQAQGIDTLLFAMDSGLRLLPVAALHDGKQFLVEKYSTALIPSVNLLDTRYRNLRDAQVLAMGANTFANQAPLPAVPVELQVITQEWPGKSFLNQDFTVQRLVQERLQGGYPIVHLATHADFVPGRLSDSYIEFGNNQRLTLPQLRTLPLREPNVVELLTLSACRTAVGDVNAELGFAGLAVQAGVKSALASLWYASDEGTLALMREFYQNLQQVPIKVRALRQAQVAMLQGKVGIKGGELRGLRGGIGLPPAIAQRGDRVLNHPYYS
jgi:CHAT domain-containing protein